ncbi:hypothetical protein LUX33_15545 [Actinomadura madurae]|uniref:hypothetical protein n=1 Tax=Actinomadura madurae TaxID=1993 RepID=UPI0020D22230|nr:hypothetical protein [Actinomadura madurae]MCP9949670.1 hypothetical protein [Actinomadura madurae]
MKSTLWLMFQTSRHVVVGSWLLQALSGVPSWAQGRTPAAGDAASDTLKGALSGAANDMCGRPSPAVVVPRHLAVDPRRVRARS